VRIVNVTVLIEQCVETNAVQHVCCRGKKRGENIDQRLSMSAGQDLTAHNHVAVWFDSLHLGQFVSHHVPNKLPSVLDLVMLALYDQQSRWVHGAAKVNPAIATRDESVKSRRVVCLHQVTWEKLEVNPTQ
jgi:hypothetical protein